MTKLSQKDFDVVMSTSSLNLPHVLGHQMRSCRSLLKNRGYHAQFQQMKMMIQSKIPNARTKWWMKNMMK